MTRLASGCAALLLVGACSRDARPAASPPSPPPARAAGESFVTAPTSLRREPADPQRARADGGKPLSASLALLQRGERVVALETRGDWSRVRASDGTEGWVRSTTLLGDDGVSEGTVLTQAWAFDRPDLLAVNVKRKVDPGSILLVVKTRDLFSEVDVGQGQHVWILSDRISSAPDDVMAAKLVEKARNLARSGHADEAKQVLDLLRARLPNSPLVAVLSADLGEAPAADGGAPDAGPAPPR